MFQRGISRRMIKQITRWSVSKKLLTPYYASCSMLSAPFSSQECFPGTNIPYSKKMIFLDPHDNDIIPCYRILDEEGNVIPGSKDPQLSRELCIQIYSNMIRLTSMDSIFYDAQRQGRMSFYLTSYGEEAIQFGSASACRLSDMVFAQYREPGILMWRGYTLQNFADQCFSNIDGHGKGRQMPIHYGSPQLNYHTISSPLATQIPHAVGAAYSFKLASIMNESDPHQSRIVICYFGEGAASEGDFHGALNFASTLECPILFFVRNNGFAISTPTKDQFRGDGIASRGAGYGIPVMRVDGNDFLAVHEVTKHARAFIIKHNRPVIIEAMSYRVGHHSTSDDSTRYREIKDIKMWKEKHDPINRAKRYLMQRGWWSESQDKNLRDQERGDVLNALQKAENKEKPSLETMFEDVYSEKPLELQHQEKQMLAHAAKYPEHYAGSH